MSGEISQGYRYIVRSPDVRGGQAPVAGTRIGVHDVIGLLQSGETVDSLVGGCFPMLAKAQVYECLAYYEDHRGDRRAGGAPDGARSAVRFLLVLGLNRCIALALRDLQIPAREKFRIPPFSSRSS